MRGLVYILGVSYILGVCTWRKHHFDSEHFAHRKILWLSFGFLTRWAWSIHHTDSEYTIHTYTPEVVILCAPGVCIILTYIHTDRYTLYWPTVHNTQIDTLAHVEGIICVHRVYIILTQSTQHTERFSDPLGMYSMCTWSMHHAYSYTTYR